MTLHDAVKRGDTHRVFDLLKAGADVNELDSSGHPPIWYVFGDGEIDETEFEERRGVFRILELQGADLSEPSVKDHLVAEERRLFQSLFGEDLQAESEPIEADLGKEWRCDVKRTREGFTMWLVDHPHVRVSDEDAEMAQEQLFERIGDEFGDLEPNLVFVGDPPESL